MTPGTGTTPTKGTSTLWQKIAGRALAERWSQKDRPPTGTKEAGFYIAALASGTLDSSKEGQIARCLLWCDFNNSFPDPARHNWYRAAFRAFPKDEKCAFFTASLCSQKGLVDPDLAASAYREVLQPEWKDSKYWKRFGLSKRTLLVELAALYAAQSPENASAEEADIVEVALNAAGEDYAGQPALIGFLCRVYQLQGRTDEYAESTYRWVFNRVPENTENGRYLANLYRERGRPDSNAGVVYRYMAALAEENGDLEEADQWFLLLAQAYLSLGQIHSGHLSTFERAVKSAPNDSSVAVAYFYSLAQHYCAGTGDSETTAARGEDEIKAVTTKLEAAIEREAELRPLFESHRLEWAVILRALALAYGHQNRADVVARALYARAIWMCPEDIGVWALHALALAEREDYSESALIIYEKVIDQPDCDESILIALAHTYIGVEAEKDKERRPAALRVWETLYQKGNHWPELISCLTDAYMGEGSVNDTAVSLWERQAAASPRNGALRLRLAQELRLRGDIHSSLRYYKEAAKLLPKDFEAQFETGLVLKDSYADYSSAIKLLQKAVKLPEGKTHLQSHFALAEALLFCDKRTEAKKILQKITDDIDPEHTPTLLHLAKLNLKYEDEGVRLAEAFYAQASALNPNDPETYKGMADLYRERGQMEEEEQALEKYLMLSEPDATRYRQLANLYIRKRDFLRAESALRQVIALGQGDKPLYTLLGEVILQGRTQAAS
ncbi:MAG: hypothetical protein V4671_04975 [Armatimonadota bacterium]